jgi:uncharacterized protein involved in outer membrane biogenesis
MRTASSAVIGLAFTVALAACGGGGGGGGTPGTERAFTRQDSAVTVVPDLVTGGYTATQIVTLSNDDAGASHVSLDLRNAAGSISSSPTSEGYQIQITLTAMADTEAQARAAVASMGIAHRDAVAGSTLYLSNEVKFGPDPGSDSRLAAVAATVPAAPGYRLYQAIPAGSNSSSGLHGSRAQLDSASGAATLSGTWDAADVNSVSGAVTVSGDIPDLQVSSISGALTATLACARSTTAMLDTTSGTLDATVTQGAGTGFDLDAQTTSGAATIVVAGTLPEGPQSPQHAHFRSTNYATSNPKIVVAARSVSGAVNIHD